MAINPAFLGHGIWLELSPLKGLKRYATYKTPVPPDGPVTSLVDNFIEAISDMRMSSVWFELFTRTGVIDKDGKQGTKELVAGLNAAKIHAIPWGYCYGKNSEKEPEKNDLTLIKRLCDDYKLDLFVADIEPWNNDEDKWKTDALEKLLKGLNEHFGKENLGLSSFANIDENVQPHARELLPPLTPLVSFVPGQSLKEAQEWSKAIFE